jgi:predicted transcriptional regulator
MVRFKFMIRENFSMASSKIETDIALSADIISAYVSFNSVPASGLPELIHAVHATLTKLGTTTVAAPEPETLVPAVSIRKSITPEYLICLDDGKKFKSLKKHIATLGMTPNQYRHKWSLPNDYPMVAPEYAATRSALAKKIGLGQFRKETGKPKSERKLKAMTEKTAS